MLLHIKPPKYDSTSGTKISIGPHVWPGKMVWQSFGMRLWIGTDTFKNHGPWVWRVLQYPIPHTPLNAPSIKLRLLYACYLNNLLNTTWLSDTNIWFTWLTSCHFIDKALSNLYMRLFLIQITLSLIGAVSNGIFILTNQQVVLFLQRGSS